ncbi:MAG TPA: 50S ribosomal protein L4 [Candidatus Norongarragalinales archaeon]|jgi:large subunit ribosomal protein L4e|nr:50S ribosomal protein L4 [Candidatus Norongarragalinales archaeon]
MKALVKDLAGKEEGEVQLPLQFDEAFRPDVIKRAYHAQATMRLQPKGAYPLAGIATTAQYYGRRAAWRAIINTGRSRLPREKIAKGRTGKVRIVPHSVGGRRAHPPVIQRKLIENINRKEKMLAIRSAIAATAQPTLVSQRGHNYQGRVPVVIDAAFENVKKAKEARGILEAVGLTNDMQRAADGRKRRTGIAGLRRGGYRTPKSALVVIAEDKGVWRAARNIPGVDIVRVDKLTAEDLAPGGVAGRLTVWTQSALEQLKQKNLYA